jgi:hypothetical protein
MEQGSEDLIDEKCKLQIQLLRIPLRPSQARSKKGNPRGQSSKGYILRQGKCK